MASVPPSKIKVIGAGAKKAHGSAICIRRAILLKNIITHRFKYAYHIMIIYPAVFIFEVNDPELIVPGRKVISVEPMWPFSSLPLHMSLTSINPIKFIFMTNHTIFKN